MIDLVADAGSENLVVTENSRDGVDRGQGFLRLCRSYWLPLVGIALPTLLTVIYYSVFAAPLYVSESRFIVRLTAPPSSNAFSSLLQTSGLTRSQDDTFSVQDYLESRDALRALKLRLPIRDIYNRPESDWLSRFPRFWESNTFEGLFSYFNNRVRLVHNTTTGITVLRTTGFRSQDARLINDNLLTLARHFLSKLNDQAQEDTVRFAEREVSDAEMRVMSTQTAITAFRNREMMIDPKQTSTAMLELIGRLSDDLAATRTRREELLTSAPQSAEIGPLDSRVTALQHQIDDERAKMVGQDASVAPRIAEYEQLALARDFAEKALTSASGALDSARAEARRQQLYLELIVEPDQPDEAEEPQSLKNILIVFIATTGIFLLGRLLVTAVRDYTSG
jgi:capsular polysaccharide transport system permease protein